jgi:tight adherence protein C
MLLLFGSLFIGLAAFAAAEASTIPARQRREVVRRASSYGAVAVPTLEEAHRRALSGRAHAGLAAWIANGMLRLMPRTTRSAVTERLLRGGIAHRISADEWLASKTVLAFTGGLLGLLIGAAAGSAVGLLLVLSLGLLGFVLPDIYVNSRYRDRQDRIQAALPDALDLLAVTVEAGLGFDAALAKLTDYLGGPLAEEFALALNEMRLGETRIDALKRMASRVDVRELNSFVRAVVQADQLGMSMGSMLRIQAADVRVRRQLSAEEKAMKMPIKMVFPMVFCLLPATFIVILGPFFLRFGSGGSGLY